MGRSFTCSCLVLSCHPQADASCGHSEKSSSDVRSSRRARALLALPWTRMAGGQASQRGRGNAHIEHARMAAAAESAALVRSWNEKAAGFSLKLNKFADMLPGEFESVMLGRRDTGAPRRVRKVGPVGKERRGRREAGDTERLGGAAACNLPGLA